MVWIKEAIAAVVLYVTLTWMFVYWLVVHSWRDDDEDT